MKINEIKISKKRRPLNQENIESLAKSIDEMGLFNPILIDTKNNLIAGHHRLQALVKLGHQKLGKNQYRILELDKLKIELAELDENLVRNQLSWQEEAHALSRRKEIYEQLYPETKRGGDRTKSKSCQNERISFCKDAGKKLGLHERSVQQKIELSKMIKKYDDLALCNSAAEARFKFKKREYEECKVASAKRVRAKSEVFHGDCLNGIRELKNRSVSCVLTDPPYGINWVARSVGSEPIANDDEKAFPLFDKAMEEIKPKLKPDASIYVFCPWKTVDVFKQILEKHFQVKNILVWKKNNHGIGDLKVWADIYELIIYATPGNHQVLGKRPVNVLEFDRNYEYHSCEKPVDLLSYIIEKSTVKGELVLDIFAGSGSTGVAAKKCKRKYKLMELEKKNIDIIHKRLGFAA